MLDYLVQGFLCWFISRPIAGRRRDDSSLRILPLPQPRQQRKRPRQYKQDHSHHMQPQCRAVSGLKVHLVCSMVSNNKGDEGEDEGQDCGECRDRLVEQMGMSVIVAGWKSDLSVP